MQSKNALLVVIAAAAIGLFVWIAVGEFGGPERGGPARDGTNASASVGDGAPLAATDLAAADGAAEKALGARTQLTETSGVAVEGALPTVVVTGRVVSTGALPKDERAYVVAFDAPRSLGQITDGTAVGDALAAFRGEAVPLAAEAAAPVGDDGDGEDTGESDDTDTADADEDSASAAPFIACTEVAADGTFRLELDGAAARVHLAVVGRYLYSDATTPIDTAAASDVALFARLGGWLTGTLVAPPGCDVAGDELDLRPDVNGGVDTTRLEAIGVGREVRIDADGTFEFTGVPPRGMWIVAGALENAAAVLEDGVVLGAGEHVDLRVEVAVGAHVAGTVVDESGAPIAGAKVTAQTRGARGEALGALRDVECDPSGAFVLAHLSAGPIDIVATKSGLLEARHTVVGGVADGQRVEGVVLVLTRGGELSGRVVFQDGAPAAGAKVAAGADLSQLGGAGAFDLASTRGGTATTDADGRFALTGLSKSTFNLTARLDIEDDKPGHPIGAWRAVRKSVTLDAGEVELVLLQLASLQGRVVAAHDGTPVQAFTAYAELEGSGAVLGIGATRRTKAFEGSADGAFELVDLEPGTWKVSVGAPGFAECAPITVTVARDAVSEPTLFSLTRGAAIAGTVVDPTGAVVPGARVALELDQAASIAQRQRGTLTEVLADAEGAFLMDGLAAGTHELRASADGYASCAPFGVEVNTGETTADVVLTLRRGGTLEGRAFLDDGSPAAGHLVILQPLPTQFAQLISTIDSEGEFEFTLLEPGTWQVIAMPDQRENDQGAGGGAAMASVLGGMKIAMVDIVDGETTTVVLGEPPPSPLDLTVRVTSAGDAVPGAIVSLLPQGTKGKAVMSGLVMKVTDGEGACVLRLAGGGEYLATVQLLAGAGEQTSVEYPINVPKDVSEHTLEFELPGGSIAGRVTNADGEPLGKCRVTVTVDDGVAYGSVVGGGYVETSTGADGRYEVRHLRAGTYSVSAGGAAFAGLSGDEPVGGRVVLSGLALGEGARLEGVDFELAPAAQLVGRVVDAGGTPINGASVFVRAASGAVVDRLTFVTTDASGRFEYTGLAPGDYTASARKGALVSAPSALVRVGGEAAAAELALVVAPGTTLLVSVVDGDEEFVEARVTVTDADGRVESGLLALAEMVELLESGFSTTEQRVGPLSPGDYTVKVVHADGRTKSRKVKVDERGGEKSVRIKLE
jgi:hypothetical protein